ncbi:MAG: hypothetical protein II896_03735 [Clostridia bacterium]|nr:hypothetical protein [Clostridia bacterium]
MKTTGRLGKAINLQIFHIRTVDDYCESASAIRSKNNLTSSIERHCLHHSSTIILHISCFYALVFAVTHEYAEFGECYSFLYIPDEKDEWDDIIMFYNTPNTYYAFAYVWNKDYVYDSEFGSILVKTRYGGLKRVA